MSRYEVVFSSRALVSLRQVTRYIAEESGRDRAASWLAEITDSTVTLETHPYAFPLVGEFEAERIRYRGAPRPQETVLASAHDLATRKFGQETAKELSRLLARTTDVEQIDRVAAAIVDCDVPDELSGAGAGRLAHR